MAKKRLSRIILVWHRVRGCGCDTAVFDGNGVGRGSFAHVFFCTMGVDFSCLGFDGSGVLNWQERQVTKAMPRSI